jgi:hypothetical protein
VRISVKARTVDGSLDSGNAAVVDDEEYRCEAHGMAQQQHWQRVRMSMRQTAEGEERERRNEDESCSQTAVGGHGDEPSLGHVALDNHTLQRMGHFEELAGMWVIELAQL